MKQTKSSQAKSQTKVWHALFLGVGALLLLFAQSAFWINHTIFDKQTFTSTAQTVLTEESSRDAIATAVVDKTLEDKPVLRRVAGDRASAFVSSLLGTDISSQAISRLLDKSYAYLTTSDRKDIAIDLTAIKTPISGVVSLAESRGSEVKFDPSSIPDEIVLVESDDFPDFSGYMSTMLWLAPLLWLGTLVSFGLYIYLGRAQYAKRIYATGLAILGVSVIGLLAGPFVPPPIASMVQNIELRTVVQNLVIAFMQPYLSQMYTTILVTSLVLIVFNQRFNLLHLVKKLEGKIQKR